MLTDLREMQFEILPNLEAETGFVFGIGSELSIDENGFQPGASDWTTQDTDNSTRGVNVFGRDRLTGPSWTWQAFVNRATVPQALETIGKAATAWRPMEVMESPQEVTALRYRIGDRVRRIYGRPRKFDAPPANGILNGYVPVSMDFRCADAYTYDDVEQSVAIGLAATSEGGFSFPATFPIQTLPEGTQSDQVVVGGDARTYPVIRFNGPMSNPSLITQDWTLTLNIGLTDGQHVDVDLRPWRLTALRNDGVSVAGAIGKRQRLSQVYFEPGRHDVTLRATASGGSAGCEVRWTSAWNSI